MGNIRGEVDKIKIILVGVIISLLCYIFLTERSINKIDVYTELMDNYTYIYGGQIKFGYSIPLEVDYIQNDTLYLVTREPDKSIKK